MAGAGAAGAGAAGAGAAGVDTGARAAGVEGAREEAADEAAGLGPCFDQSRVKRGDGVSYLCRQADQKVLFLNVVRLDGLVILKNLAWE